ncbi:MAG: hypothetical protein IEMM0006_1047 [bacterium]|nr:MAG: hypothetical protein IEMM0006_1047 [bacterium]
MKRNNRPVFRAGKTGVMNPQIAKEYNKEVEYQSKLLSIIMESLIDFLINFKQLQYV